MRGGGVGEMGGRGAGGDNSYNTQTSTLISSWSPLSYGRHGATLPAFRHRTISKHTMQQDCVNKTRKDYYHLCSLLSLRHNTLMNYRV